MSAAEAAWEVAASVPDPELPMVTLADLGILRRVDAGDDGGVVVTITPTYSGCPAMAEIRGDLRRRLDAARLGPVEIRTALAPPWTTDWITAEGRAKLAAAGVAPPPTGSEPVACVRCGSADTTERSRFGPTPCTALYRCQACGEPFEHVRAH